MAWRSRLVVTSLLLGLLAAALVGCRPASAPAEGDAGSRVADASRPPADPEEALFERIRGGTVQIQAILDALAEAYGKLGALPRPQAAADREALDEVQALLDSAAATLADFGGEPPTREAFRAQLPAYDEQRLEAIQACNDAYGDLEQAIGILRSLTEEPGTVAEPAGALADTLTVIADDLRSAIETLGGVVEPLEADPPPADGSSAP